MPHIPHHVTDGTRIGILQQCANGWWLVFNPELPNDLAVHWIGSKVELAVIWRPYHGTTTWYDWRRIFICAGCGRRVLATTDHTHVLPPMWLWVSASPDHEAAYLCPRCWRAWSGAP